MCVISRLITVTYLPSWTFDKLLPFRVSAISLSICPMSFRPTSDQLPTQIRRPPDSNPSSFRAISMSFRTIFDEFSNNFRPIVDQFSTNFRPLSDQISTRFRQIFDQLLINFRPVSNYDLHFDELHLAYVGQCYFYNGYVNRGLLDAIPLPRTTPDKHENYHQCVCVSKLGTHKKSTRKWWILTRFSNQF